MLSSTGAGRYIAAAGSGFFTLPSLLSNTILVNRRTSIGSNGSELPIRAGQSIGTTSTHNLTPIAQNLPFLVYTTWNICSQIYTRLKCHEVTKCLEGN